MPDRSNGYLYLAKSCVGDVWLAECTCLHFCKHCGRCLYTTCDDDADKFFWTADCFSYMHKECEEDQNAS